MSILNLMKIPKLSIDDYHSLNPILASLIEKYGLQEKTIWFIDLKEYDSREQIRSFSQRGFQIGSHTMTHAFVNHIPKEQAKWEIEESKKVIEELTGKECEAFCYPRGRYNKETIEMIKNAGYKWARTTKLEDGKTEFEISGLHLSYPRSEYEGKDPFSMVKDYEHYWAHYKELQQFELMDKFEKLLKWLKSTQ